MSGGKNVLEVRALTVAFGDRVVLDRLDLDVERGSIVVVIGPNGSGKTILFRTLIGALPHQGVVRWAPDAKIGYVPQKLDIERDLPVSGMDLLRAKANLTRAPNEAIERALLRVGLSRETVSLPIGASSAGQFQRVLLAFALIGEPNVLLLDEPAAGIDAPGQQQFDSLLREMQQQHGITVLLISHDLSVVYRHASKVLCLGRGSSCFGPPQQVLAADVLDRIYGMPAGLHVHAGS